MGSFSDIVDDVKKAVKKPKTEIDRFSKKKGAVMLSPDPITIALGKMTEDRVSEALQDRRHADKAKKTAVITAILEQEKLKAERKKLKQNSQKTADQIKRKAASRQRSLLSSKTGGRQSTMLTDQRTLGAPPIAGKTLLGQ